MRFIAPAIAAAGLIGLAACSNTPAENAAANVEENADMAADNLEMMADNATNEGTESALENEATAVRNEGDNAAEAIENGTTPPQ